jgi:hypothetical protein
VGAVALLLATSIHEPARAADPVRSSAATDVLAQKGLSRLKPWTTSIPWVFADEAKIHETLDGFRTAEAADHAAAKRVKEEAAATARDRDVLSKAEKRYQELTAYKAKPDTVPRPMRARFRSAEQMLAAINNDLDTQADTINRLRPRLTGGKAGGIPASLKKAIADWMESRNNLILADLAAEPDFNNLAKRYQELGDDSDVAAALKSLGKNHRLGSKDFEQDKKAMAAAAAIIQSGEVPMYREGLYDYVGAILNETAPIVLRIDSVDAQSANWAPAELLTKAGISVEDSAPKVTLTLNGKRTIQCRQVMVPQLRLGKHVLTNLPFLAMPDGAKDLGAQLIVKEFKDYDMTPDLEKWIFTLIKKEEPKASGE